MTADTRHSHEPTAHPPMRDPSRVQAICLIIIAFSIVLFMLVEARFLLISLATAIIVFSLTSDAINFVAKIRIGKIGIPNWAATIAAVLGIGLGLIVLTSIILSQINTVLITTLSYSDRTPGAVSELFAWLGEDAQTAIFNSLSSINASGYLSTVAGQAGNLMQGTVLVILFVGFLFAERIWFTTKLTNFVGDTAQAERVGKIAQSIIRRVNRYLLVKTAVSVVTGVMVWGVALAFDLDLAVALGVMTFILNYIPNVGSIVATFVVALVAHVQLGDPTSTFALFMICGSIQFINGSVIDPRLMGRALRLSSFGIIISLAFWGAVWGIPGMFLSVPIMVGLMIICSEIPAMRPLAILLSREGLPEPKTPTRKPVPLRAAE